MRALLPLLLVACGTTTEATWHGDIRPVVEATCQRCHTGDASVAPFSLMTYEEVKSLGPVVVAAVEARQMPPWGMDADCQDVVGSMWLSEETLALFAAWEAHDFPEGDPATYVAPEVFTPPEPTRDPDLVVAMEPYAPDRSVSDDYRCLVLGEPLLEDAFVTGVAVRPGNLDIAHHAILYAIPPAERDTLDALEASDPDEGFDCFGGPGSEDATMVTGWAPGGQGYRPFEQGVALRIAAGSTFVLQMHYNTLGGQEGETDATAIDLWTLPSGVVPDEILIPWPIAYTGLDVPAGEAHSVQRTTNRVPIEGRVLATSPHMHVRGLSQQVTIHRADGAEECVAAIPDYDFQWQRGYAYTEALPIGWSDEVEIRCIYDNSADNQPVVDGERLEPQDIAWGEGTLDEMCLNFLTVATPFYGSGSGAVCDGYEVCAAQCAPADPYCRMACMSSAGESCFACGVDGMFGDCSIDRCLTQAYSVGSCMDSCATHREDALGCLYDRCGEAFDAYWACAEEAVDDGRCAADFADCPTIAQVEPG